MPQPCKYRPAATVNREGVKPDPTSAARMRAYRKRKLNAEREAERTFDKAYQAAYEQRQREGRAHIFTGPDSPLWEFYRMLGLRPLEGEVMGCEAIRQAWKRNAARLHPDRPDGDAVKAARLNELRAMVMKIRGWNHNEGVTNEH